MTSIIKVLLAKKAKNNKNKTKKQYNIFLALVSIKCAYNLVFKGQLNHKKYLNSSIDSLCARAEAAAAATQTHTNTHVLTHTSPSVTTRAPAFPHPAPHNPQPAMQHRRGLARARAPIMMVTWQLVPVPGYVVYNQQKIIKIKPKTVQYSF